MVQPIHQFLITFVIILLANTVPQLDANYTSTTYQPTPPPVFNTSGSQWLGVYSGSGNIVFSDPVFTVTANWNIQSSGGSGQDYDMIPSDIHPAIALQLIFQMNWSSFQLYNVRFENLFNSTILLAWADYVTSQPRQIILQPYQVSEMQLAPVRNYVQSPFTQVYCSQLFSNGTSQSIWYRSTLWFTITSKPNAPYRTDMIMIQLMPSGYAIRPRSEQYQILLADRRQHPQANVSTDFQYVSCAGSAAAPVYQCDISLNVDPDRSMNGTYSNLTSLLWQYYIYDVRRCDSWEWVANTTIIPMQQLLYQSIPSQFAYPAYIAGSFYLPRVPVQFMPVADSVSYVLAPSELIYQQPDEPQLSSDVCSTDDEPSCNTLYVHSGMQFNGFFSTSPGDIYLCLLDAAIPPPLPPFWLLGVVDASGTTVTCTLTRHVFHQYDSGQELAVSLVYYPADRGYHSHQDEVNWAQTVANDLAERLANANGDANRFAEEKPIASLSRTIKSVTVSLSTSLKQLFAYFSSTTLSSTSSPTHQPDEPQLSQAQQQHVHSEHIQALLSNRAGKSTPTASASPASGQFASTTNHAGRPKDGTTDIYAWKSTDFTSAGPLAITVENHPNRFIIASAEILTEPAYQGSWAWTVYCYIPLATGILVGVCLLSVGVCAICERYNIRLSYSRAARSRRPHELDVPLLANGEGDELLGVQLIDDRNNDEPASPAPRIAPVQPAVDVVPEARSRASSVSHSNGALSSSLPPLPSSSSSSVLSSSAADDWVWRFDFKMEAMIKKQVARAQLELQQQEVTRERTRSQSQAHSYQPPDSFVTSASFTTNRSSSPSFSSGVQESKDEIESQLH